jgi:type IV secretion system protein VirB8
MSQDPALEQYFAEAASWDADRAAMNARSVRVAWRVAFGACLLTGGAVLALVLLMPLKRVEPFVIRVDNSTGVVDVVPAFVGKAEMPEAVTRYFLTHYVTVCERFNFETAESDYEECAAFHAAARNQAWAALWDRTNPASPLNQYKDGSWVRAQVSAVSFFTRANGIEDLAQVRYIKIRRTAASANDQVTHWISTVAYVYGEPSKDPRIRRWNPLGFKIIEFRSEPEVLPTDTPGATHAQTPNPRVPTGVSP